MRSVWKGVGWALLLGLVLLGVGTAWRKGVEGRPEWSYWHRAATSADPVSGLEGMRQGYLPGVSAPLRLLFFLPERLALAAFVLLNLACAVTLFFVLVRVMLPDGASPGVWLAVWLAAPFYLALQNNQLVLPMLGAAVLGFESLRGGQRTRSAILLGLSPVIKALSLAFLPLLLLRRRFIAIALLAGLLALALSLLGAAGVYGWETSGRLHAAWPLGVLQEDPARVLERGAAGVASFEDNQSAAAWIVRAGPWLGPTAVRWLRRGLLLGSLLPVAVLIARRFRAPDLRPDEIALWLAWVAFAAPFGRYYYSVLLVPAWLLLASGGDAPRRGRWLAGALPLLTWGSRSAGWYAAISGLSFAWVLFRSAARSRTYTSRGD